MTKAQEVKPWMYVLTVGLGVLLNPLNSSMIAVALTDLQREYHLTFADATWLISAFYIASAAAQPVMGKFSDMFGHKRLFITGLIIVALSSALAPFSPNYWALVGFRALQAVGSSTLFPSGMAVIRSEITQGQAQALSAVAVFSSVSAAFGPSIGGFLVGTWNWEAIFLVNLPLIILGVVLALVILPGGREVNVKLKRIDFSGIALFCVFIVTFILFLLSLGESIRWWAVPVFMVALAAFGYVEKKREEPFIDLVALKSNTKVTLVYLQFLVINIVFYCIFFGIPTFLQQVSHYSESKTGVIMLAVAGFGVVLAPLAGYWIDRAGSKPPLILGSFFMLVGMAGMLTIHEGTALGWLVVVLSFLGVSNGLNNISMQTALYDFVTPEETGTASGLFQTSRYLGAIFSSTLLGLLLDKHMDVLHLHYVVMVCAVLSVVITILSWRLPSKKQACLEH